MKSCNVLLKNFALSLTDLINIMTTVLKIVEINSNKDSIALNGYSYVKDYERYTSFFQNMNTNFLFKMCCIFCFFFQS